MGALITVSAAAADAGERTIEVIASRPISYISSMLALDSGVQIHYEDPSYPERAEFVAPYSSKSRFKVIRKQAFTFSYDSTEDIGRVLEDAVNEYNKTQNIVRFEVLK